MAKYLDYAGLQRYDDIVERKIEKAIESILPEKTATGNPISISDASGFNAKSAKVTMLPIQDLHGYNYPWAAGAGKNKFQNTATTETINGVTFTVNSDGSVLVNGTATGGDSRFTVGAYIVKAQSSQKLNGLPDSITNSDIVLGYQGYGTVNTVSRELNIKRSAETDWNNYVYITVKDGITANNLLFKPMIRLATETDPTFAPYENICHISGRDSLDVVVTGINQWDEQWELGGLDSVGQLVPATNRIRSKNYIRLFSGESYYVKAALASTDIRISFYDAEKAFISNSSWMVSGIITAPSNALYAKFVVANLNTYGNNISINYPSTDTEYHAYNGETHTATFPSTVYGGEYEFVEGKLTENMGIVDLGSLTWIYNTSFTNPIFYAPLPSKVNDRTNTGLCSCYPVNPVNATGAQNASTILNDNEIALSINTGSYHLFIRDESFTSAESLTEFLNGKTLVYELATPTETTLTPQSISLNKGENVITTDGDNAELKYSVSLDSLVAT